MKTYEGVLEMIDCIYENSETMDVSNQVIIEYADNIFENFIRWKIAESVVWIIVCIIVSIILIKGIISCIKLSKVMSYDNKSIYYNCIGVILMALLCATLALFIHEVLTIIECLTFPEQAMYDYISSLRSKSQ